MFTVIVAALFIAALGAALCFFGYRVFLVLLPIIGFFAGFWLGAEVVSIIFGTGYLAAPFETDQAAFMARVAHRPDVRIRINMDLRIVASGTHRQIESEADRVLALAGDRPNVCLGTGALPYETDPNNVRYLIDYVERVTSNN